MGPRIQGSQWNLRLWLEPCVILVRLTPLFFQQNSNIPLGIFTPQKKTNNLYEGANFLSKFGGIFGGEVSQVYVGALLDHRWDWDAPISWDRPAEKRAINASWKEKMDQRCCLCHISSFQKNYVQVSNQPFCWWLNRNRNCQFILSIDDLMMNLHVTIPRQFNMFLLLLHIREITICTKAMRIMRSKLKGHTSFCSRG